MPPDSVSNSDLVYLWHITHACEQMDAYIHNLDIEQFKENDMLKDAAYWRINVIGEAIGNLSQEFVESHQQIDWRKARSARNRIVHGYDSIEDAVIWEIATVHIPKLLKQITPLIPEPPQD